MQTEGFPRPMSSRAGGPLQGVPSVPGDKSISHRSLILGSLAVGQSRIAGLLEGEDVLRTAEAMRALGAGVRRDENGSWLVQGVGTGGFAEPADVLDFGNSGTGARLVMGAVSTTPITVFFTGDASLRSRPMQRILEPLTMAGASCRSRSGGRLPMAISGCDISLPIRYAPRVASAQIKSAILLAGLNARGTTTVIERSPTRDHTERMLNAFGADISHEDSGEGRHISVTGYADLQPFNIAIPRDPSSAAFPVVAATLVEGSNILISGVCMNPTRTGLYTTLLEMGADIVIEDQRIEGGEEVADLRVRSTPLSGVEVPPDRAPSMIDEYPILAVAAANAKGVTTMHGIGELRHKETDRISAMAEGLRACGVKVTENDDSLVVSGMGDHDVPGGARCRTFHDHRIAMSFLCLGLTTREPVQIDDGRSIGTSFPGFVRLMNGIGANIEELPAET